MTIIAMSVNILLATWIAVGSFLILRMGHEQWPLQIRVVAAFQMLVALVLAYSSISYVKGRASSRRPILFCLFVFSTIQIIELYHHLVELGFMRSTWQAAAWGIGWVLWLIFVGVVFRKRAVGFAHW